MMPPASQPPRGGARPRREQFSQFAAASLYCPKCRTATPVREQLLLVLPDGNLYDYRCSVCGTSTGTRTARQADPGMLR